MDWNSLFNNMSSLEQLTVSTWKFRIWYSQKYNFGELLLLAGWILIGKSVHLRNDEEVANGLNFIFWEFKLPIHQYFWLHGICQLCEGYKLVKLRSFSNDTCTCRINHSKYVPNSGGSTLIWLPCSWRVNNFLQLWIVEGTSTISLSLRISYITEIIK